jgi:hypothetical protein
MEKISQQNLQVSSSSTKYKTTISGRSRSFSKKKAKRGRTKSTHNLKKADKIFSDKVRIRDGKCLHPKCICHNKRLQCSHFYPRNNFAVRFDPDNCITLGWLCHFKDKLLGFEYQKQRQEKHGYDGQYTLFMKSWLGEERFKALEERSLTKKTKKQAIQEYLDTVDNLLT